MENGRQTVGDNVGGATRPTRPLRRGTKAVDKWDMSDDRRRTAVKCLERGRTRGSMDKGVIPKLHKVEESEPQIGVIQSKALQVSFKGTIYSFSLTVKLRVVSRGKIELCSLQLK